MVWKKIEMKKVGLYIYHKYALPFGNLTYCYRWKVGFDLDGDGLAILKSCGDDMPLTAYRIHDTT